MQTDKPLTSGNFFACCSRNHSPDLILNSLQRSYENVSNLCPSFKALNTVKYSHRFVYCSINPLGFVFTCMHDTLCTSTPVQTGRPDSVYRCDGCTRSTPIHSPRTFPEAADSVHMISDHSHSVWWSWHPVDRYPEGLPSASYNKWSLKCYFRFHSTTHLYLFCTLTKWEHIL